MNFTASGKLNCQWVNLKAAVQVELKFKLITGILSVSSSSPYHIFLMREDSYFILPCWYTIQRARATSIYIAHIVRSYFHGPAIFI